MDQKTLVKFFTAPIRLVSEANQREHWATKYRRKMSQQRDITLFWRVSKISPRLPCEVTITRIGKRKMDSDNLAGSCKHVQDAIADAIGIDDGDARIRWTYAQETGAYAVRVSVSWPADGQQIEHEWRAANRLIRHR